MAYGCPYKGSKNKIADWVLGHLPPAEALYDLFCGGCAITHAAMLSGKYKRFVINDIEPAPVKMFTKALRGEYKDETRWISREDFFSLKDEDEYVKYCWSFGNNGCTYVYGESNEPIKKALHYDRVYGDSSLLSTIASDKRRIQLESHGRLKRLQKLENAESVKNLESYSGDYQAVPMRYNGLIYCDIPYHNTTGYEKGEKNNFDYARFYDWACSQELPVYISEYWMPEDRFVCVAQREHKSTISHASNSIEVVEKLFVPALQYYSDVL